MDSAVGLMLNNKSLTLGFSATHRDTSFKVLFLLGIFNKAVLIYQVSISFKVAPP